MHLFKRASHRLCGLAVLLLAADSAHAAELVVGSTTLEFKDASRQRSIVSELWFEAAAGTTAPSFAPLPPLQAFALATDAKPAAEALRRPLIDAQRIGFVGHSFGGWTGVSLAGGRYSYDKQLQACRDQTSQDQYCTGLIAEHNPATPVADGTRSFRDERFKRFYLMASGPAAGFDEASLQEIRLPMVFDTAKADPVLAPSIGSSLFTQRIPGSRETLRNAGHFSYAPLCKPLIGRLLAGQVCEDPPGVDRAEVHARVAADAVRFFKAGL